MLYLELSNQILIQFVEEDNKRILSSVKKLLYFYNKYLFKRKQKYFYEFYVKIAKLSNCKFIKKKEIHNRLFNCSLSKEKNRRDLEKKFYQDEEQLCTFSPKTNRGKINCHFSQKKKSNQLFQINISNPRYCYSFKSSNINNNINLNNNVEYSNEQFAKTNPIFYSKNKRDKSDWEKNNNALIKNKEKYAYNLEKNFDLNLINKSKKSKNVIKYNMININNKSFFEENNFNRTSRNYYFDYIKTKTNNQINSSAAYLNYYNSILNNFQIEENKSNPINIPKKNNFLLINNFEQNVNENNFYKTHSNLNSFFKNRVICNLVKENINDKKPNAIQYNYNNEYSEKKEENNKSLNDLYNAKAKNEKFNCLKKYRNSLRRNNLDLFNEMPISLLTNQNQVKKERILYESIKSKENIIKNNNDIRRNSHKKSKSLNYNKLLDNGSSSFLNNINTNNEYNINNANGNKNYIFNKKNYLHSKSKELIKESEENDLNHFFDKTKENSKEKKDYYYTFRKGKIPYNSFNYLSTKRIIKNEKNHFPISLIDMKNKRNYNTAHYNPNIYRTNSIYLNNYNKKICRLKKNQYYKSSNNSFHKNNFNKQGSFVELTTKKDRTRQISNTNFNTNNETKGCSISSFSLYQTKTPKEEQSIKNSDRKDCCKSIPNSKNKSKKNNLYNHSNLNTKRTFIKKNNQNIRKYINSININENIIENKTNKLNYYYCCSNEKNNASNKNNLEIDSNVVNECYIFKNYGKQNNKNKKDISTYSNKKSEKSITLQSFSDSKMLELAEHYINKGDDSMEQMDIKMIELKKKYKKEKATKDITFG